MSVSLQRGTLLQRRARVKDGLASDSGAVAGPSSTLSPLASPQTSPREPLAAADESASTAPARAALLSFRCDRCQQGRVSARVVDRATAQVWLLCKQCNEAPPSASSPRSHVAPLSASPAPPAAKKAPKKPFEACVACEERPVAARVVLNADGRSVRVCKRCASLARDARSSEALLRAGRTFGEPLVVLLRREAYAAQQAPLIVLRLASFVVRSGAIKDEGVFRVAGRKDVIDALQADFEVNGTPTAVDRRKVDPHCATAVLKAYLRELPEPLLTTRLWAPLIAVAVDIDDKGVDALNKARPQLLDLLSSLPPANRAVLAVLLFLLSLAIAHSDTTRMSVHSAAICISPSILCEPQPDLSGARDAAALRLALEPARLAARMAAATRVISCLVRYYHDVFISLLGDGAELLRSLARFDGEQQLYFGEVVHRLQSRLADEVPLTPRSASKVRPPLPSKVGVPKDLVVSRTPSPQKLQQAQQSPQPQQQQQQPQPQQQSQGSWKAANRTTKGISLDRKALSASANPAPVSQAKRLVLTATSQASLSGALSAPPSPSASPASPSVADLRRSHSSATALDGTLPVALERSSSVSVDFAPLPELPEIVLASSVSRRSLDLSIGDVFLPKRVQSGSSLFALDLQVGRGAVRDQSLLRLDSRRFTDFGKPPTPPPLLYDSDESDPDLYDSDASDDSSVEVLDLDALPAPPTESTE
jgi:transcription elongation factor Elf1